LQFGSLVVTTGFEALSRDVNTVLDNMAPALLSSLSAAKEDSAHSNASAGGGIGSLLGGILGGASEGSSGGLLNAVLGGGGGILGALMGGKDADDDKDNDGQNQRRIHDFRKQTAVRNISGEEKDSKTYGE